MKFELYQVFKKCLTSHLPSHKSQNFSTILFVACICKIDGDNVTLCMIRENRVHNILDKRSIILCRDLVG